VTVYSVYEPPAEASDLVARAEALVFVKEGFSWPALLLPGLWLLYRRLWVAFALFLLLLGLLAWALGPSEEGQSLLEWLTLGIAVLLAFEANDLRAAALERRGYALAGIAIGPGLDAAELSFLRTWLPREQSRQREREQSGPHARPAGPASGGGRLHQAQGEEVIGLFPRP